MGYNENFSRAVFLRDVPTSMLIRQMEQLIGKPEEEKQIMLEAFAKEIHRTCPVIEGKKHMLKPSEMVDEETV